MPLLIRKEQFEVLQMDSDLRWYERELVKHYPSFAEAPCAQRLKWVRDAVQRGLGHGVTRADLLQYLCFEQTFPYDALQNPEFEWARRILSDPELTSGDRVKRLRQQSIRCLLELEARQLQAQESSDLEEEPAENTEDQDEGSMVEVENQPETISSGDVAPNGHPK